MENMEKYKVGIPKMAPSKLKIKMNGILKIRNNATDSTTSFCSWRFFMDWLFFFPRKRKNSNTTNIRNQHYIHVMLIYKLTKLN